MRIARRLFFGGLAVAVLGMFCALTGIVTGTEALTWGSLGVSLMGVAAMFAGVIIRYLVRAYEFFE